MTASATIGPASAQPTPPTAEVGVATGRGDARDRRSDQREDAAEALGVVDNCPGVRVVVAREQVPQPRLASRTCRVLAMGGTARRIHVVYLGRGPPEA